MYAGARAFLLLPLLTPVWSRVGKDLEPRITAPPVLKRGDPIADRTDFLGYELGYDNTCEHLTLIQF
jgi:hypothetical protein